MGNLSTSSLPCPHSQIDITIFSSWVNNCAETNETNGVDLRSGNGRAVLSQVRSPRAVLKDPAAQPHTAVGLPGPFLPTLTSTDGSTGVIKSFILPGNKTGVVRVLDPLVFPPDHILWAARCSLALSKEISLNSRLMSKLRSNSSKHPGSRTS
jgi:hypothetical protein